MKAANALRQRVAPTLAADPQFSAVETSVTTHPGLRVHGEVPDEKALRDLQRLMQAPPGAEFRVIMHAKVTGTATTRPAD